LAEPKAELLSHQQLRCFCAAAELGSFTAAADALGVTQPAVAQHIRKMEDLLGVDLFVRAGRGVVPTDAGRTFADHAARSLQALDDAAGSVGELIAMRHGVVALGTFSTPTPWRLHEVAAAFLARHPGMTVRLIGRNSSVIADRVRRGELEAALVLLPIDDEQLDVRPILRDEVLYVSASRDNTRRPATIEQLASRPLVFYDAESADNDPIRRQLAERAQARGLRIRPRVEVELIETALRLVADGLGDTYLPSAYTHAPYYPNNLHTVAFSPALHDTFAIVTRPGSRLSPGLREFLHELERHMLAVATELDSHR
jgi:DNA-binding transcriptional LysR family regulator